MRRVPTGRVVRRRWGWALRRRLRSPLVHWLAASVIGVAAASLTARTLHEAEVQRDRYGRWTTVAVAARDLPAGTTLGRDDVTLTRLPIAMVPRSAWSEIPRGRRTVIAVERGEVLVRGRTPAAPSATAAQIDDGQRAMGIPLPDPTLRLTPGDRLDVLALDGDGRYRPAATAVDVLDVTDGMVTVAVRSAEVGAVAGAVAAGTVQVALRRP